MKRLIYNFYRILFAKARFEKFNRFIITLGLKGIGINNFESDKWSGEEHFIDFVFNKCNLKVIFDVGANEGNYTSMLINRSSMVKIYCFEPVAMTYERLSNRFRYNNQVSVHNIGLSDKNEQAFIFDEENNGTSHATLYKNVIERSNENISKTKIELVSIDDFVQKNKIDNIDLLKIDTEGNEYKVLLGGKNILQEAKVKIIQFEFNEMNVYSGVFFKNFIDLLPDYNLYRLLPNGFLPIYYDRIVFNELFVFQNIVAFRKDIDPIKIKR